MVGWEISENTHELGRSSRKGYQSRSIHQGIQRLLSPSCIRDSLPRTHLDLETYGPNIKPPILLQFIRLVNHLEIHTPQQPYHYNQQPHLCIHSSVANPLPVPKPLLSSLRQGSKTLPDHTLGLEFFWFGENGWVTVNAVENDDERLFSGDGIFAAGELDGAGGGGKGFDVETRGSGGEAKGFAGDSSAVREVVEMGVREFCIVIPNNRENFVTGFGNHVSRGRRFEKVVDGRRDGAGGSGGTDGHGDDLVDDLCLVHGFSRFGVCGVHHGPKQIFAVGGIGLAVGEAFGGVFAHGGAVAVEFGGVHEPIEDFGAGGTFDGFAGCTVHGRDHGAGGTGKVVETTAVETLRGGFHVKAI